MCKVGLVAVAAVGLPLGATIGIEGRTGISNVIVINGALSGVRTGIGINIGSTSMHIWLGLEVLAWVHDLDSVLGMNGADGATEMGAIGVSKPTFGLIGSVGRLILINVGRSITGIKGATGCLLGASSGATGSIGLALGA